MRLLPLLVLIAAFGGCGRDEKKQPKEEPAPMPRVSSSADLQALSPVSASVYGDDASALWSCTESRGMTEEQKAKHKADNDFPPKVRWSDGPCLRESLVATCAVQVALDGIATTFFWYQPMFTGPKGAETLAAYEKSCSQMAGIWTRQ